MSVLVTTGIVLLLLLAIGFVYDRMARLKRAVHTNWRQLEQQRQRRRAIAGRIAEVCAVPTADARAIEAVAVASQRAAAPAGPPEAARHEAALGEALSALLTASAIAMSPSVAALARELGEAEHAYREARQAFNDTARRYNTAISVVPGSLIARIGGFPRAELFDFP